MLLPFAFENELDMSKGNHTTGDFLGVLHYGAVLLLPISSYFYMKHFLTRLSRIKRMIFGVNLGVNLLSSG